MPDLPEHDPALRDRVGRLLGVLRQLAVATTRPVRHANAYAGLLWLADAQEQATVQLPGGPGDELLRVPRVQLEHEPPRPAELDGWTTRAAGGEPVLDERAPEELWDAFDDWLASWRPWAERERSRRPRVHVFEQLFELYRTAADRPESVELVVAAGLLHAPGTSGGAHADDSVHVHLVGQPVTVEQDPETGDMVVALAPDSALRLEDDEVLAGLDLYDRSGAAVLREKLLDAATSPLDPALPAFLKEWASRALRVEAAVSDAWEAPSGHLTQLSLAPALVARRRGASALREYYDVIARSLADEAQPVPLGLAQLVEAIEPDDRLAWLERAGGTPGAELIEEPLFPLPANAEQSQILRRLGSDSGVVVEGPPGTGKTHTIANLVSALLARGQRVLVTAEKAQALRVLRDKLPVPMQELCVSLTDASARGSSDLARSVAGLAAAKTDFDPERADRRIADLRSRRAAAERRRDDLLGRIAAQRGTETEDHGEVVPGYAGTLSAIARALAERAGDGWVPGEVTADLPLDPDAFDELVALLRGRTDRREARRTQVLPADPLPEARVRTLAKAASDGSAAASGDPLVAALGSLGADGPDGAADALGRACRAAADAIAALRALPADRAWAGQQADALLAGSGVHAWQRATGQLAAVDAAVTHDKEAGFAPVAVADLVDPGAAAPVFERYADYLRGGGAVRRAFRSTEQKDVERYGTDVTVGGAPVTTAAAAATAAHHLRVLETAHTLSAGFAPLRASVPTGPERGAVVERMLQLRAACRRIGAVVAARDALERLLAPLPPAARPPLRSVAELARAADVALAVTASGAGARAAAELAAAADAVVESVPPPARSRELQAVARALRAADPAAYTDALAALAAARAQQAEQARCDELLGLVRAAAPALADLLPEVVEDPEWAPRLARWPFAWAHARARTFVTARAGAGAASQLTGELAAAVGDVASLTGDLAAALAWRSCLQRMTARQVQALQSYRGAMANVGKGTGKYAEKFRRAAREAMGVAQDAVPAWVMPISQVLATVPPRPDSFDVVIVDEASQAELTSAFLLWLAPRVIVVGDDKQCTPSEVSSGSLEPVFDRLDTELGDVPLYLRTAFTPKDSVFTLLRTRFGQVVRLREHFRCMPEIIGWSSAEFYADAPLVPVRQFGADRLPPLRTTHVPGAVVEGAGASLVNRAEAAAIADAVAGCLADPAYDGRTFGVVVLQGQAQVDVIRAALLERVPPEEWEARRLRVGTPPDFQGDERSVVWLSLVVAPGHPLVALTRREFQQRFNVAASRAQDQLWLVHSVQAADLRPTDLRHSLLTYLAATSALPVEPVLAGVSGLARHEAFGSLFEQRVFLDLVGLGYHVRPRVEVNGRVLDLVVTGASGSLAVDCDGDADGRGPVPDAADRAADLAREQELTRCGWTFARVRESAYRLDPDAALAPLLAELDRLGIEPLDGAVAASAWRPVRADGSDEDGPDDDGLDGGRHLVPDADPVLSRRQGMVLSEVRAQGEVSANDAAVLLGVDLTTARTVLSGLVDSGALEARGRARTARYSLPAAR